MQRTLVDEKRWIGQRRFLHALNYCMLLPGPEAQQLAIYIGWLLNGVRGGLIAGTLFVLPGVIALLGLSAIYVAFGDTPLVDGLFLGLAPAVIAIVIQAVVRVSRRALTAPGPGRARCRCLLALRSSRSRSRSWSSPPVLLGWLLGRIGPALRDPKPQPTDDGPAPLISRRRTCTQERPSTHGAGSHPGRRPRPVVRTGPARRGRCSAATASSSTRACSSPAPPWSPSAAPTPCSPTSRSRPSNVYGWLAPGEMVSGLALAETTPGPLIMVVQFVAFVGAYRDPGSLDPWVAAVSAHCSSPG